MRIDRLRLKGILAFDEPVDLDFTTIPPGLIAIVGENGAGKTTLMEAFAGAVYGQLPTRGAALKYASGKDSYLEAVATFDQSGQYRARLNLDGVKSVSEAILERLDTGERLSDGKVTTYKTAVDAVFPSLDTLLASSMAVQNRRGSFATRNRTDRKDLFYTLLGLGRLDGFATTCRAAVALLEKRIAELSGRISSLEESAGDAVKAQLEHQANALHIDVSEAEIAKRDAETVLAQAEARLSQLRADVDAKAAVIAERANLEARRGECQRRREFFDTQDAEFDQDLASRRKAIDGRLASAIKKTQDAIALLPTDEHLAAQLSAVIARVNARRDEVVTEREVRIAKNRGLLDRAQEVRDADTEIKAHAATIAARRAQLETTRRSLDDARVWLQREKESEKAAEAAIATFEALTRQAALLSSVPCGGAEQFATCQFLKDAAAAKSQASTMSADTLQNDLRKATARANEATAAIGQHETAVQHHIDEIGRLDVRIKTLQPSADLLPHLEAAEDKIADYRKDIETATTDAERGRQEAKQANAAARQQREADRTRLEADADTARTTADAERAELTTRHQATRAKRDTDRAAVATEEAAIAQQLEKTAGAADAHQVAVAAAAQHDAERARLSAVATSAATAFARLEEQAAHLRARQEAFNRARGQWDAATAGLTTLETERIEWQALAQMLGREGLPVLEIDAAGPGVSAEANDLLQAASFGRFAVELVTQEPKADGKGMKEVFELKVYDHECGGEARDLADLSGGEQVIVDSALRLAIALWVNRRNEQPIRTVWLDETTGALDPENAQRYLLMLRRLHERAGLFHLIFVSHNPAVSQQADVQLQVADGQVRVVYPPFAPVPASQEAA
jgi:exonuclease SbcC